MKGLAKARIAKAGAEARIAKARRISQNYNS